MELESYSFVLLKRGPRASEFSDEELERLQEQHLAHLAAMRERGHHVEQQKLPAETMHGSFVPPTIIEISSVADVEREVFGPVLHVLRFRRENLDTLIDEINATGYGLTFGLHTRLDETIAHVAARIRAGNLYVNRNVIGAVVGVQPFGGRGLSGTGPKAGGPLYLDRLVATPPRFGARTGDPARPLRQFADWLEAQGETAAAAVARRYGEASALGIELELPGPVGERNIYALQPRGSVLLRPATHAGLYAQMAAVLASGNRGRVEGMALPAGLPAEVARVFAAEAELPFAAALVEGSAARISAMMETAAAMPGPIVSVYAAHAGASLAYPIQGLLEEVSTSINTTAAGGNAHLMMIS
jgi:RHH-type proline utilization regulon transcriptional repressor/proline dehydrogenase/delta 1-pyrroline-5-carboxylate dehydrogenase